ncbi:hypothetical protein PF008_g9266 [Phytophthora fragariae]|nr:hypothetical protein PF008_g9266 [Phytophthora fragariae]
MPEKAALYAAPPSRVQAMALANWESAPSFVLDDHLGEGFPRVSSDRLLNKCNPFLSGKRRALSDDIASEAPTVSTDCSMTPENDTEDHELSVVKEESDVVDELEPIAPHAPSDEAVTTCKSSVAAPTASDEARPDGVEPKRKKKTSRWVCVANGRYIKREAESTQSVSQKVCSKPKAATLSTTRWVQVGHGHYKKIIVNGATKV